MKLKTKTEYVLVGSDFSQQEPRLLSFYSQDSNMIQSYKEGKDLYATIASKVYKKTYWECMEHNEDGTPNPDGATRRGSVKSILLGIMYGRGSNTLAEQIHCTKEEAQKFIDDFYSQFPTVKEWSDNSLKELKEKGYITDFYGRRRRLPDATKNQYDFELLNKRDLFNPIIGSIERKNEIDNNTINIYNKKLSNSNRKESQKIIEEAAKEGIKIIDNSSDISRATRQCVNARIQGGAATMTKIAMNKIARDEELKKYDFTLLLNIHDELIGQCKKIYAEQCANRLCEIMKTCISDIANVPFKCDPAITKKWYADSMGGEIGKEKIKLLSQGKTEEEILDYFNKKYVEFLPEEIYNLYHEIYF